MRSSPVLRDRVQRLRWLSLPPALVTIVGSELVAVSGGFPAYGTVRYMLAFGLRGLSAWCWVLAFLGRGKQYLTGRTPFLSYTHEAVLPFYTLHPTVILGIGYFVVQWAIPSLIKWAIIFASSLTVILALYEVLVRRFNVLCVLLGLKWRPKAPGAHPKPAVSTAG